MAKFSKTSLKRLRTVHPDLQTIFQIVVLYIDCSIVDGLRTTEQQQNIYAKGRTKPGDIVTYCDGIIKKSRHQSGNAVDVIPYPTKYSDKEKMIEFAGIVLGISYMLRRMGIIDIELEWGGHWKWSDPAHFEIKK